MNTENENNDYLKIAQDVYVKLILGEGIKIFK